MVKDWKKVWVEVILEFKFCFPLNVLQCQRLSYCVATAWDVTFLKNHILPCKNDLEEIHFPS